MMFREVRDIKGFRDASGCKEVKSKTIKAFENALGNTSKKSTIKAFEQK